jgi:hypothetical protein
MPHAGVGHGLTRPPAARRLPRSGSGSAGFGGVGEAEAGVTGGAAGQGRGEDTGRRVVIVVDLGGVLAREGTQDPSCVLDQASLPPDRGGEEQGVQGRAVEALAGVRSGGHD